MFIIGDVVARYTRKRWRNVFFPIATHYSGNTAHRIAKAFASFYSKDQQTTEEEKKLVNLYKKIYRVPSGILQSFIEPMNILNFYNQESLWELKMLDVSGDYEYSYTTWHEDFPIFINKIISVYKKNGLLVQNKNNELALNYDDALWKKKLIDLVDRTEFIQPFHKNNILSAMQHIRNDWWFLRDDGFGVIYENEWIIDPMFDSELFTIFDLYIRFQRESSDKFSPQEVFDNLFEVLNWKGVPENVVVQNIVDWLPCDTFVCEEHLKNWAIKKLYAECSVLDEKYQTRKYFVLGMWRLDGTRMSASRGTAILANDLVNMYGSTKARLIILMCGGHPSKEYEYDKWSPEQADKLLNNFINYYTYLVSIANNEISWIEKGDDVRDIESFRIIISHLEEIISKWYYRQAIVELLSVLPSKYQNPSQNEAKLLISLYEDYLNMLLPSLLKGFSKQIN